MSLKYNNLIPLLLQTSHDLNLWGFFLACFVVWRVSICIVISVLTVCFIDLEYFFDKKCGTKGSTCIGAE